MKSTETFVVEVTNRDGERLYRREFRLSGDKGEEGTEAFSGVPARITVTSDRYGTIRRKWPETDCGSNSAGGADLYLTAKGVQVQPDCSTQYLE